MTQFTDNNPHNIEAPQKLYIQYSHDIEFDYSTGRMPDGTESGWDWEEQYIPVSHVINGRTVGRHTFMRIKVGVPSYWTVPIAISNNVTNVDTVVSEFEDDGVTFSFTIKLTFTDGTSVESDPITIRNGEDGTKIASAVINEDGYLIMTYDDGTVINAGMAKGEDAVGIPQFGDDGSVLVIRSNIAGWEDPINILAENLSGTNPIEYDNITGIFSHNIDDGNRHIPVGGSLGALLSTDGAGNYTWEVLDSTLKAPDEWDASVNTYPILYKGRAVEEGDTFYITVPGTMGTVSVNIGDLLVSKIGTPAQIDANWFVQESNRDQATETILGVAKIATQLIVDTGTNDTDFVTSLKLNTLLLENYSYKINSLTDNSFASFQPDGTNEYLTVKGTDANLIAEFLNDSDISIFNVNQNDVSTPYKMTVGTNLTYDTTEGQAFGDGDSMWYENTDDNLFLQLGTVNALRLYPDAAHSVAGIADYETLVVNDDDIPNKKYVDDTSGIYVTVGIGGNYDTIEAAITAGERFLLLISDVTLTADINITGITTILGAGDVLHEIDMATYQFIGVTSSILLTSITFTTGTAYPFTGVVAPIFEKCIIRSYVTAYWGETTAFKNCYIHVLASLFDGGDLAFYKCTLELTQNSYFNGDYYSCKFVGAFNLLNAGNLHNCTFSVVEDIQNPRSLISCNVNISGNVVINSTGIQSKVIGNTNINNLIIGAVAKPCYIEGNEVLGTCSIDSDYHKINGNNIIGTTTLNAGAANNVITGNTFTGAFTDNSGETTNIIKDNIG